MTLNKLENSETPGGFDAMGFLGNLGISGGSLLDLLPMISKVKEIIPKIKELIPVAKNWEETVKQEGEVITYSAMLSNDDLYIYVIGNSQVSVKSESTGLDEPLVRQRIIKRFVASELVDKLNEFIPGLV